MAANVDHNGIEKGYGAAPVTGANTNTGLHREMTHEEHTTAQAAARFGYGPLAHVDPAAGRLSAFGGEFQPGLYRPVSDRKLANPAPLGLSAFALTTFVLSLINMQARNVAEPNIVVGLAFGYGGLVQLLAGMWYVWTRNGTTHDRRECTTPLMSALGKWRLVTPLVPRRCPRTAGFGSPLPSL